jgi:hypothetical protein
MDAEKIEFRSLRQAIEAIEALGASNSEIMGTRAVHINVTVRMVPGREALLVKRAYNEVGAEAAISHDAYYEKQGAITDMIVMGTLYQHREVRRVLAHEAAVGKLIRAIEAVVEAFPKD